MKNAVACMKIDTYNYNMRGYYFLNFCTEPEHEVYQHAALEEEEVWSTPAESVQVQVTLQVEYRVALEGHLRFQQRPQTTDGERYHAFDGNFLLLLLPIIPRLKRCGLLDFPCTNQNVLNGNRTVS